MTKKTSKIDPSLQKYDPEYKDLKFTGEDPEKEFELWLCDKARYIVEFEDHGQDCLKWYLDEGGEVLHSVLQSRVWNGKVVDLEMLRTGKNIGIMDPARLRTCFLDFIPKHISII